MTFGELLLDLRTERKVSLRELATAIGKSPIYLSDIERGARRAPPIPVIFALASNLGVDPMPLLELSLKERDSVEIDVHGEAPRKREAALSLARIWDELDEEGAEKLNETLKSLFDKGKG